MPRVLISRRRFLCILMPAWWMITGVRTTKTRICNSLWILTSSGVRLVQQGLLCSSKKTTIAGISYPIACSGSHQPPGILKPSRPETLLRNRLPLKTLV